MIGAVPDLEFQTASTSLGTFAKLCIYSDGVYEIERDRQNHVAVQRVYRVHEDRALMTRE